MQGNTPGHSFGLVQNFNINKKESKTGRSAEVISIIHSTSWYVAKRNVFIGEMKSFKHEDLH